MSELDLPTPWVETSDAAAAGVDDRLARIGAEPKTGRSTPIIEDSLLEQTAGCRLTYDDMEDADVSHEYGGPTPRSRRAYYVMGHRWVEIENTETGLRVRLRLQTRLPEADELRVSAVVIPFDDGRDVTTADMRSIPLAAIAEIYTRRHLQTMIISNRMLAMGGYAFVEADRPVPGRRGTDEFLAMLSIQYEAVDAKCGGKGTAERMAKLNGTSLPTMQRWLAEARRRRMLAPLARGVRPGSKKGKEGK